MNVCDTVTILRRGKVVDTIKTAATTAHKLAKIMVGREVNLIPTGITQINLENAISRGVNVVVRSQWHSPSLI
ncbi:hypothetical protein [Okeania sp. KiyG1]|uniref:hypothetical protein n=1 Tax=Okeania sp. KiyG1 TaxID=2720165 RepID=UPI0019A1AA5C|nr:hypothetical protein [Okeania sp. KiyG1]GGA04534.1 hypothetical protein CYANOKiyG1_16830 [Okeania sp. KiyG1]